VEQVARVSCATTNETDEDQDLAELSLAALDQLRAAAAAAGELA
jgi:hypothetical protein